VVFDFCSGACGDRPIEPSDGILVDSAGNLLGNAGGGKTFSGASTKSPRETVTRRRSHFGPRKPQ
jgi:hypothetical protein